MTQAIHFSPVKRWADRHQQNLALGMMQLLADRYGDFTQVREARHDTSFIVIRISTRGGPLSTIPPSRVSYPSCLSIYNKLNQVL